MGILSILRLFLPDRILGKAKTSPAEVDGYRSPSYHGSCLDRPGIYLYEIQEYLRQQTGSDRRDCLRKVGYSLRGKPAKALKLYCQARKTCHCYI